MGENRPPCTEHHVARLEGFAAVPLLLYHNMLPPPIVFDQLSHTWATTVALRAVHGLFAVQCVKDFPEVHVYLEERQFEELCQLLYKFELDNHFTWSTLGAKTM